MGSTPMQPAQDLTFGPGKALLADFAPEQQRVFTTFGVTTLQIREKRVEDTLALTAFVLRTGGGVEVVTNGLRMQVQ